MSTALDSLVDSLLHEGYALYPYTPGATKNATPTPFGIVYPPAYAAGNPATFDHAQMECVTAEAGAPRATVHFLQAQGEGHQAQPRRVDLDEPAEVEFEFDGLRGRVTLEAGERVRLRVDNLSEAPADLDRTAALHHALLSTQLVLELAEGRFVSPLESEACDNVNTWPVLAADDDRVMLGATIVLPDHPQLAPESRGSLFDGTEIEEALLLHVHALSDGERAEIAEGDPAVQEMVERAVTSTPEQILALHGRVEMSDPREGEAEASEDGRTFRRGDRVLLHPGGRRDAYDRMLEGRPARIERLYRGYDDRLYLAVTVEGDPAHELLGSSGRYLFFFPEELEVQET